MIKMVKPTIKEMQNIAESQVGKCLSKKYLDARTKLTWQCEKGHIWEATPNKIKTGTWCPYCVGRYQTIKDMQEIAKQRGGKCLSKKYISNSTKLTWQCKEGHIWKATPGNVKWGTWCPYRVGKYKTINDMKKAAESRGGKCLSKKYINDTTKLVWQCREGHTWKATPGGIKQGHWCPICARIKRTKT